MSEKRRFARSKSLRNTTLSYGGETFRVDGRGLVVGASADVTEALGVVPGFELFEGTAEDAGGLVNKDSDDDAFLAKIDQGRQLGRDVVSVHYKLLLEEGVFCTPEQVANATRRLRAFVLREPDPGPLPKAEKKLKPISTSEPHTFEPGESAESALKKLEEVLSEDETESEEEAVARAIAEGADDAVSEREAKVAKPRKPAAKKKGR